MTSYFALNTRTPADIDVPTGFFLVGISAYMLQTALIDYSRWFNLLVSSVTKDGETIQIGYGTIPENAQVPHYIVALIPFLVFITGTPVYFVCIRRAHLKTKRKYIRTGFEYEGAEQAISKDFEAARALGGI